MGIAEQCKDLSCGSWRKDTKDCCSKEIIACGRPNAPEYMRIRYKALLRKVHNGV